MSDCPMCLDRGVIRVIVSRSATMAISALKDCPVCVRGPDMIRWHDMNGESGYISTDWVPDANP